MVHFSPIPSDKIGTLHDGVVNSDKATLATECVISLRSKASITGKDATVDIHMLYRKPLGSQTNLVRMLFQAVQNLVTLRQIVLNVSDIRINHSEI